MPDRRQGDRRETSKLQKKLSISLGNFIFIVIIFILVIASIFLCSYVSYTSFDEGYKSGYDLGKIEHYNNGYNEGYNIGYSDGYDEASNIDYSEE